MSSPSVRAGAQSPLVKYQMITILGNFPKITKNQVNPWRFLRPPPCSAVIHPLPGQNLTFPDRSSPPLSKFEVNFFKYQTKWRKSRSKETIKNLTPAIRNFSGGRCYVMMFPAAVSCGDDVTTKWCSVDMKAAEYKFPDPIPEFADAETEKFRDHLLKKLPKKQDVYGDSVDEIVGICTELFSLGYLASGILAICFGEYCY